MWAWSDNDPYLSIEMHKKSHEYLARLQQYVIFDEKVKTST